jgi:hypothetical protein
MSAPIILATHRVAIDIPAPCFAVVAKGFVAPAGMEIVDIEDIVREPTRLVPGLTFVVVGLSRMMTPSNRVRLGGVLHDARRGVRRIVVDRQLFVGEPWRLWWHFRCVGADDGPWGLTDSFLAETRWQRAREQRTTCPFALDAVVTAAKGVVRAEDAFRFGPVDVDERPVSDAVRAAYAREKERAFTNEKTLPAIIRRLAAVATEALPERAVPSAGPSLWDHPPSRIVCTDLAVDRFLVGEVLDRMALTNAVANACTV